MTDKISDYPKSSCICYNCENNKLNALPEVGVPTNMSVRDCKSPNYFNCYDKQLFATQVLPQPSSGYTILNPQSRLESYDKTFQKINCNSKGNGGSNTLFTSTDPRLISPIRGGQVMTFDRPPINYDISLDTINTDKTLSNYGRNYRSYADVNAGQIMYYIDKSREYPFYEPLFSKEATMKATLYQDPMGGVRPQYDRISSKKFCPLETTNQKYHCGSSFMEDTQEFREDIMARQMRKQNEQRYEPRWATYENK